MQPAPRRLTTAETGGGTPETLSASAAIAAAQVNRAATTRAGVIQALGVLSSSGERFEHITRAARDVFGVPLAAVNLVDACDVRTLAPHEYRDNPLPIADSFCGTTVLSNEPLIVPDARKDPRFSGNSSVAGPLGMRFYAGVPLSTPGGTRVGSLCILDTEPRTLDGHELAILTELAHWVERTLVEGRREDDLSAVVRASQPEPLSIGDYEIDGRSSGCAGLGDFVDWQAGPDGIALTVGEVLGAGHGAGFLATSLRSAVRARALQAPEAVVAGVETQVDREFRGAGTHAALFHALLEPSTGRLDWVDAGLGLAIHVRADGSHELLRSRDLPIALHGVGEPRAVLSTRLKHGDALLVATWGFLGLHDDTIETLLLAGRRLHDSFDLQTFLTQVQAQAEHAGKGEAVTVLAVARR